MNRRILLVEPGFRSKYPPLGLMKIAQYHNSKEDRVSFIRGLSEEARDEEWDRVYVSSMFTYDWHQTIKTLKYYRYSVREPRSENLVMGGVMATLLADDIKAVTECRVVTGLLDTRGKLGYEDDDVIDSMVPDYDILVQSGYRYPAADAYFFYTTRGCTRRCPFCAVHQLEPTYKHFLSIARQIEQIEARYGPKKDLLLLDNNVLASRCFSDIIREIKKVGFSRGAKLAYTGKLGQKVTASRYVDFNQGLDARLLDERKMALLSEIAIRPLRIAFDNIGFRDLYEQKVRLAAKHGMKYLSNYVLFNYDDKPDDLYSRLRINLELNQELGLHIFSFPMRYIDLRSKNRFADSPGNLGEHWNRKYLRAVQCVLNATRGIVSPNISFFEEAFGADIDEFHKILLMPEDYIIHRYRHRDDGSTGVWWREYNELGDSERDVFLSIVLNHDFDRADCLDLPVRVRRILTHYVVRDAQQLSLFSVASAGNG